MANNKTLQPQRGSSELEMVMRDVQDRLFDYVLQTTGYTVVDDYKITAPDESLSTPPDTEKPIPLKRHRTSSQ